MNDTAPGICRSCAIPSDLLAIVIPAVRVGWTVVLKHDIGHGRLPESSVITTHRNQRQVLGFEISYQPGATPMDEVQER